MFSKISRYRKLPDVAALDAKGRVRASKSLRLLPEVGGDVLHTVEEGDRLDRMAYTYYKQPRDWWRIADANPAFLEPQALLGDVPWLTVQLPLSWDGPAPPWADLLIALRETLGVASAVLGMPEQAYAVTEIVEGPLLFDLAPALVADLDTSARAQEITPGLAAALLAGGVTLSADVRLATPDAVTWRLIDRQTRQAYTVRWFEDEGLLSVYESAFRYEWIAVVTYNRLDVSPAGLIALVESRGFGAESPIEVHRIGKSIVIPPRNA